MTEEPQPLDTRRRGASRLEQVPAWPAPRLTAARGGRAARTRGRTRTTVELALLELAQERAALAADRVAARADRERARAYLEQVQRDELTGLLQRKAGRQQLQQAVDRAQRTGDPLVLAFLDVDQLKPLNDEHGHEAGDRVLAAVGAALRDELRSYDVQVRYGGDEFVCALPGLHLEAADRRLQQVSVTLAARVPGAGVSVGTAELVEGDDLDSVVRRADEDMYRRRSRSLAD